MYTTDTTYHYKFKVDQTCHELIDNVHAYLKKKLKKYEKQIVSVTWGYIQSKNNTLVVSIHNSIPDDVLNKLDTLIPKWTQKILHNEEKEKENDLKSCQSFLKTFVFPTIQPKYKYKNILFDITDFIKNEIDIIKDCVKDNDPVSCHLDDVQSLYDIFHLVGKNKLTEAYEAYRDMDTYVRQGMPKSFLNLITEELQ